MDTVAMVKGIVYTKADITSNPGIFTEAIGVSGGALGGIGEVR